MAVRAIEKLFRREKGEYLIELKLRDLDQFFNNLDPSPFHEKDLDDEAERYIVGLVRSFRLSTRLKLVFYVPPAYHVEASRVLPTAVEYYFDFRAAMAQRELQSLRYEGGLALIMGLVFLAACIGLRSLLGLWSDGAAALFVGEGLMIIGWVAMWRPVQIFLYDWWALVRMRRVYEKIRDMTLEIVLD